MRLAPVLGLMLQMGFTMLLGAGAWYDWRARRVPNALVLMIVAGALLNAAVRSVLLADSTEATLASPLLGAMRGAMLGAVLGALVSAGLGLLCWLPWWLLGMLGAGDVKFFAASAAWIGFALTWRATLLAALLGGVLSAAMLWHRTVHASPAAVALPAGSATTSVEGLAGAGSVPFAIPMAIALGLAVWLPQLLYLL